MFEFYLKIYRTGLINFCGSNFEVDYEKDGSEAKFAFREYDNGRFKFINPKTKHPNILKAVISGKKGWGLWVKQWTEGIVECSFTKEEILKEFQLKGIEIPESLMLQWDKLIVKMKNIRNENYLKQLEHNGFMTLVSCDYDEILTTIIKYSMGIRYTIYKIKRKFRSVEARNKYLKNKM